MPKIVSDLRVRLQSILIAFYILLFHGDNTQKFTFFFLFYPKLAPASSVIISRDYHYKPSYVSTKRGMADIYYLVSLMIYA